MKSLRSSLAALLLLLAACKPPDDARMTAVVGAVLIGGTDAPPVSRSVLVVAGSTVRQVGEQAHTPVPAASEKYNGAGKFLIPAPVAIPEGLPRARTLAEAKSQIDSGASAVDGIFLDSAPLDEALLRRWRDLQVVFVPRLHSLAPADRPQAQRNVKTLAAAGVLIAADSEPDWPLLEQSGLSASQVLDAATRNAARAAKKGTSLGALAPGMTASFWLLDANPLESAANLSTARAARIMIAGEWTK